MKLKKLPIGQSSFENLIKDNCIYVDKTEKIYELITDGYFYFLSRPRRFGKSLLVSTLKNIFLGNKELFKGLWIYDSDYEWEKHPVIVIDFNGISFETPEILEMSLKEWFDDKANCFGFELKSSLLKSKFRELVVRLNEVSNKNVIILIDEYDKPIISHLGLGEDRLEIAKKNREILKSLYGTIKEHEVISRLRFVLLTGVSKFSKAGVFSELNNLADITMNAKYSDLLGITDEEIEIYFKEYIEELSKKWKCSYEEARDRLREYYNGYRFSEEEIYVYNPFSLINCFSEGRIKNYWFESGTPTFLVNLIKEKNFYLPNAEKIEVKESIFSSYEIEDLNIIALLFQTGYLTIKDYNFKKNRYILSYPNREVKYSFLENLFNSFTEHKAENIYLKISDYLEEGDIENFIEVIKSIFSTIAYTLHGRISKLPAYLKEAYFHILFYLMINEGGTPADMEVLTSDGRIDMLVKLEDKIYIMEFKCNQSSEIAINQIKNKKYYQPFVQSEKDIYLIGINFDTEKKNISDWKWEKI